MIISSVAFAPFRTRNRNIIYHTFLTLQIVFRNFFDFFKTGKPVSKRTIRKKAFVYQPGVLPPERRDRDIIYHDSGTLQARFLFFLQKNRLSACFQRKKGKKIPRKPGDRTIFRYRLLHVGVTGNIGFNQLNIGKFTLKQLLHATIADLRCGN